MRFLTLVGLACVCAGAGAEEIKVNPISQASVYTKIKYNWVNRWQHESGLSHTWASLGRWSVGSNLGYTQTYDDIWTKTGWTFGVTFIFKLDARYSLYSKASTAFLGAWKGEHGIRTTLYRGDGFTIGANTGYGHAIPFRSKDRPSWTIGVTLSVPLKELGIK